MRYPRRTLALAGIFLIASGCGSLFGVDFDDARPASSDDPRGDADVDAPDAASDAPPNPPDGGPCDGAGCPPVCPPRSKPQGAVCVPKQWVKQPFENLKDIMGIWGSSKADIYLIGGGGIFHSDGSGTWTLQYAEATSSFAGGGVWGLDAQRVVATGEGGKVWQLTSPGHWEPWVRIGTCGNRARAIWGSSLDDLYAVGQPRVVCHSKEGRVFEKVQNLWEEFRTIWGTGPRDLYIAGYDGAQGAIYHSMGDDANWHLFTPRPPNDVYGLWGSGDTVYAVGLNGSLLRKTAADANFLPHSSGVTALLRSIWGSSLTDIYVAGASGVILHSSDGTTWTRDETPVTSALTAIWGSSADDVYAVGLGGVVLHLE